MLKYRYPVRCAVPEEAQIMREILNLLRSASPADRSFLQNRVKVRLGEPVGQFERREFVRRWNGAEKTLREQGLIRLGGDELFLVEARREAATGAQVVKVILDTLRELGAGQWMHSAGFTQRVIDKHGKPETVEEGRELRGEVWDTLIDFRNRGFVERQGVRFAALPRFFEEHGR